MRHRLILTLSWIAQERGIKTWIQYLIVKLKQLSTDIKRLSIKFRVKFIEINLDICGIVHFKQDKMQGILQDALELLCVSKYHPDEGL